MFHTKEQACKFTLASCQHTCPGHAEQSQSGQVAGTPQLWRSLRPDPGLQQQPEGSGAPHLPAHVPPRPLPPLPPPGVLDLSSSGWCLSCPHKPSPRCRISHYLQRPESSGKRLVSGQCVQEAHVGLDSDKLVHLNAHACYTYLLEPHPVASLSSSHQ